MLNAKNYIPALGFGAKVYPANLALSAGLMQVGKILYLDPGAGSDSNNGRRHSQAYDTMGAVHSALTADQDDLVIVAGTNATGRTTETAVVTWSKRRTHVVGNGPLRQINPRNGVNVYAADTASAFKITANNCSFTNISIAGFVDADVLVELSSVSYTTFNYVHFQGIGHATPAAEATARSVLVTSSGENTFTNCTFGVDTVTRAAANASLEQTGSCPRNIYTNCLFPSYVSDAGALWVKADTGNCFERFLIFDNCLFTNASLGSSTVMTVGMDVSTTGNGQIYTTNSKWYGATDLINNVTNVIQASPVFDTNDQGLMTVMANS